MKATRKCPDREGFFWAKWISCAPGTADEQDWTPSNSWEVVEVWDNGGEPGSGEEFMVFVGGVQRSQRQSDFLWGDCILQPRTTEMVE
jgi:hypothetical protein